MPEWFEWSRALQGIIAHWPQAALCGGFHPDIDIVQVKLAGAETNHIPGVPRAGDVKKEAELCNGLPDGFNLLKRTSASVFKKSCLKTTP